MTSKVQEGKSRETVTNWYGVLKSVIDGYEQKTSIPHGVQKDAIQNGWDARLNSKGRGWSFEFELVEGAEHSFLLMTDRGTTGLTGSVLDKDEYLEGLPPTERWAAFEGYGFTKEEAEENRPLGSRGRGKFIFVGASSERQILYDTLTIDGNYRFGSRKIELARAPVVHFDENRGRKALTQATKGMIQPLDEVGARVMIVDPIDELVDAIKSGDFEFMVGETWWEIIMKYDAEITIKCGDTCRRVSVPSQFTLPKKSEDDTKTWLRHGITQTLGHVKTTITALHIVCNTKKRMHEDLRGIAIQRGGMKICTVMPYTLPPSIQESLYGYINFDKKGEEAIKDAESLEHNDISFRKAFPRDLRNWLWSQMKEFAEKELGYSPHPFAEKREKQKSAERRALSAINRIAKDLKLFRFGPTARKTPTGARGPTKEVRIQLAKPDFPNPKSTRVDYGQKIENVGVSVANDSEEDVAVHCKVFVRYGSEVIRVLLEEERTIPKTGSVTIYGPEALEVKPEVFQHKGPHVLSARIVDPETSEKIDQKSFTFHVEIEPMEKGIFERFYPLSLDEGEYRYSRGYVDTSSSGGLVLNYNVHHPAFFAVEDNVDDLSEYLFRFAATELARIDLESDEPKSVEVDKNRIHDPDYVFERFSLAIGKLLYYYHKGSA